MYYEDRANKLNKMAHFTTTTTTISAKKTLNVGFGSLQSQISTKFVRVPYIATKHQGMTPNCYYKS